MTKKGFSPIEKIVGLLLFIIFVIIVALALKGMLSGILK